MKFDLLVAIVLATEPVTQVKKKVGGGDAESGSGLGMWLSGSATDSSIHKVLHSNPSDTV